jgi:hypothetical protein
MHCIVFGSLSVAGVEEEDGVVAATNIGLRCGEPFLPPLPLPGFPRCVLRLHHGRHLLNTMAAEHRSEGRWQNGSGRCQDMCCCEERYWNACHLLFPCAPSIDNIIEHTPIRPPRHTLCFDTRTSYQTCEKRVMAKLGYASEVLGHGHTKVSSIVTVSGPGLHDELSYH